MHAPADRVWEVLDDFGGVWRYNPNVESSQVINDTETGTGACRECVFADGSRLEETVTDYRPGEGYTVEFTDVGPYPLVSSTVRLDVEEADDHHSRVTFTAEFQPKYGPFGWLLGRVVMEQRFETQLDSVLDGLATHLRTGDPIDETGAVVSA
jgi:carbon monoxide dehydrogenase subunit G